MSLDKLLIIFIIIILPIAFVLNTYVNLQADTLKMQALYDAKLYSATNDTLKAFQENSFNESYSNLAEVNMRNVDASMNVFFNALANNFNMQGYSVETLQSHVPALVFTMYDGLYLCSKHQNVFRNGIPELPNYGNANVAGIYEQETSYSPITYAYYSCRYKLGENDFVITYTMDNYITIQGKIKNADGDLEWVNDAGYVINPDDVVINSSTKLTYKDVPITRETLLQEYVGTTLYPYVKIKGVKHFRDDNAEDYNGDPAIKWFTIGNNGEKKYSDSFNAENLGSDGMDYSAYNYYKSAKEFTNRLINIYNLGNLKPSDAKLFYDFYDVEDNSSYKESESHVAENYYKTNQNAKIFDLNGIEEKDSNFNEHRIAIIRATIEKNLVVAISGFNTFNNGTSEFQMPNLREDEWELILNNISIISFMQGLPIGTKMYNGLAIVQNNKNGDIVNEKSIYMVKMPYSSYVNQLGAATTGETLYYYDVKKKNLYKDLQNPVGILNVDLEKRYLSYEDKLGDYFYPKLYFADYSSVITKTENVNLSADLTDNNYKYAYNGSIIKYMEMLVSKGTKGQNFAKAYYTAIGRERYCGYKSLVF